MALAFAKFGLFSARRARAPRPALVVAGALFAVAGCHDRASEEKCRDSCLNSVELSFWEDFADERDLDSLPERARARELQRGERMLERELGEGGALREAVEDCADVCRRVPTPPEVVECQLEAESVAEINECGARGGGSPGRL